ncbi:MAG: transglycosylase domain-containing protein [Clostridium sp.]|nr:transglycosylase domain-containing protein [Clostridium sp.]
MKNTERRGYRKKTAGSYFLLFLSAIASMILAMIKTLMLLGIGTAVAGVMAAYWKLYPIYEDYRKQTENIVAESDLSTFRLQEASYIYDTNGSIIAKLTGDEDSSYLPYEEIPENAINAFVAIEDRTFWENPGIDVRGILRVMVDYVRSDGGEMHGASTITQQLARNRFLTREVSIERKLKEMLIALDLTEKYTKEQLMEFYVNDINYANYYYGLEAAAKGYFNKSADQLTLSQTAYLCAIPNRPTYYNPYNHPERAVERRNKILSDMKDMGYITDSQYQEAVNEEMVVERQKVPMHNYETTYAIDCAIRFLMRRDGFEFRYGFRNEDEYKQYTKHYNEVYEQERNALYTGGYSLYTSLDPVKQQNLQDAIDSGLSFDTKVSDSGVYALQGAATALDNDSHKVVAIVGGRTQEITTYTLNRAFQSFRQPGSSIKPVVVYTPALENGWKSNTTVTDIDVDAAKEPGVSARNLGGATMPLRSAVERSRNGVAWSIYDNLTPQLGLAYLTQMRFDHIVPQDYYPATALGGFTYGVTTEEMAGAYSALVNSGTYREPTCIVRLVNNEGTDIFEEYPALQVYQQTSADMMVDIMKGVVTRGTAASMGWNNRVQAAGKTGTTNGSKDGWFCGVTPYYTVTVWVGYDRPKRLSSLYGGTYPAQIWKKAMLSLTEDRADVQFPEAKQDKGYGNGTYLAGYPEDREIADNYTVRDFRSDHEAADHIMKILDGSVNGGSSEITGLLNSIISPSVKLRMEDIRKRGHPGKVNYNYDPTPQMPVFVMPDAQQAPMVIAPDNGGATGPGAETGQNYSGPAAVGPAAVPVEEPAAPAVVEVPQ